MEALMGKRVTPMWLAKEAIRFEQNVLAEHVGSQDQVAAAFGGLNVIQFERDDEISVRPVIISKARKKLLNNHLMLFLRVFRARHPKWPKCKSRILTTGLPNYAKYIPWFMMPSIS